ncbi:MAG: efflux RND transporter periplasmic adaptor subunit [Gammaproteobacteria bacterium]|nr:efflux RND transporter periplasmic adaptor subunit [Gammaproteobacteria bacterium]
MPTAHRLIFLVVATVVLAGCGGDEAAAKKTPPATPISVAAVTRGTAITAEHVLGRVESATSPQLFAEVPGTVARVLVDVGAAVTPGQVLAELDKADLRLALDAARADVGRITALLANQQRTVGRYEQLHADKLISQDTLDEAQAELKSLTEQLAGVRAGLATAERAVAKARILAPVTGVVAARFVAAGDYVDTRTKLFEIANRARMRVHLPFPESLAPALRPGLTVNMRSPVAPEQVVTAKLDAVRPVVNDGSRAVEAIVQVDNPGSWTVGASVNAELILEQRENALLVPEVSVVRRPAGDVVYVLKGDSVEQRKVTTGVRQNGMVEIRAGLAGDETVAVDGAGFLTDQARVQPRS